MNDTINDLATQASTETDSWDIPFAFIEKFAELLKQAIYNEIKEELLDDNDIDEEPDIEDRCYLRGCNGGIVDALCIVQNFGEDIEE